MTRTTPHSIWRRLRTALMVAGAAATLGGCVYSPYPSYGYGGDPTYGGYYGYGYPTGGAYVAFGGGDWGWRDRGWHHGWHHRD